MASFIIGEAKNAPQLIKHIDKALAFPSVKALFVRKIEKMGIVEAIEHAISANQLPNLLSIFKTCPPDPSWFTQDFFRKIGSETDSVKSKRITPEIATQLLTLSDEILYDSLSGIKLSRAICSDVWYGIMSAAFYYKPRNRRINRRFASFLVASRHLIPAALSQRETTLILEALKESQLDFIDIGLLSQRREFVLGHRNLLVKNLGQIRKSEDYTPILDIIYANLLPCPKPSKWREVVSQFFIMNGLTGLDEKPCERIDNVKFNSTISKNRTQPEELVSIGMPAYNCEKTIGYAILSLLNQTHQNIEIIIVDDASTDNTEKISRELAKKHGRIRYLRNPINVGPYVCRNIALATAKGKYFTVNDADDYSHPARIADHVFAIELHKVDYIESKLIRVTEDLNFISDLRGSFIRKNLSSILFQRENIILNFGYWENLKFGADSEFEERLLSMGAQRHILPRPYMLALYGKSNLTTRTNNVLRGPTGSRAKYLMSFRKFHRSNKNSTDILKSDLFQVATRYPVPEEMVVTENDLATIHKKYADIPHLKTFRIGSQNIST